MKNKNTAYIDCGALERNYRAISDYISCAAEKAGSVKIPRIISVVKADAYGHGIEAVSGVLAGAGCDFFAVSSEWEAAELRELEEKRGRHPDILILGPIDPKNAGEMIGRDIICTAVSPESAGLLAQAAALYNEENGTGEKLRIHIKLDTGMNRVGFAADSQSIDSAVREIAALVTEQKYRDTLSVEGIFTHFACADEDLCGTDACGSEGHTAAQLARYRDVIDGLASCGVKLPMCHAANSAGLLGLPAAYFDAVRAGIILYGIMPDTMPGSMLTPVMRFESTVTHIHTVKKGQSVSYGAVFTAERDMTVATVAAGYADGFFRHYTGCDVLIRGQRARQIGRICMDQFMADISDCEGIRVGDSVTIFGGDDGSMLADLAKIGGTIGYEIVCGVSKRVPRVEV